MALDEIDHARRHLTNLAYRTSGSRWTDVRALADRGQPLPAGTALHCLDFVRRSVWDGAPDQATADRLHARFAADNTMPMLRARLSQDECAEALNLAR